MQATKEIREEFRPVTIDELEGKKRRVSAGHALLLCRPYLVVPTIPSCAQATPRCCGWARTPAQAQRHCEAEIAAYRRWMSWLRHSHRCCVTPGACNPAVPVMLLPFPWPTCNIRCSCPQDIEAALIKQDIAKAKIAERQNGGCGRGCSHISTQAPPACRLGTLWVSSGAPVAHLLYLACVVVAATLDRVSCSPACSAGRDAAGH